jgi:hypothetical protein
MIEEINYTPSPTGLTFHRDTKSQVRYVQGCVGGGKTSMAVMEMFFCGLRQQPDSAGERKTRWVCIRADYPSLKSTLIRTWEYWFGSISRVVYDVPIRANLVRKLPDGTTLNMEVWFLALESEQDVRKLRSLEVTGGVISEASETNEAVLEMLGGRVGRFPKLDKRTGYGPTWSGILLESNPPPIKHWLYRKFEIDRPEGFAQYKQPAPLILDKSVPATAPIRERYLPNPDAENIENLPKGYEYYYKQISGASQEYVNVFILGEYGTNFSGKPVYGQFSREKHVATTALTPHLGYPVVVGFDFGLQSAAVFTQMSPTGQVLVLDEVEPQDCTLEEFMNVYFMPLRQSRFRNQQMIVIGDPAGGQRSSLGLKTAFQTIQAYGLAVRPAMTNDIVPRIQAVGHFLDRIGGLYTDPRCQYLIEGFIGGYKFEKRKSSGVEASYQDKPDKSSRYSHGMDALQYACLYHKHGTGRITRPVATPRKPFLYA